MVQKMFFIWITWQNWNRILKNLFYEIGTQMEKIHDESLWMKMWRYWPMYSTDLSYNLKKVSYWSHDILSSSKEAE